MSNRLGQYLRQLREEKGLSTQRVAQLSGCSRSYIIYLEQGRRKASLPLLHNLMQILDGDFTRALVYLCLDQGIPEEAISSLMRSQASPAMEEATSSGTPRSAQRAARA